MNTYLRFNRHDIFNADDRSLVLDIIKKVEPFGNEANCLFGLFDGYYYDDLLDMISANTNVDTTLYKQLTALVGKITTAQ